MDIKNYVVSASGRFYGETLGQFRARKALNSDIKFTTKTPDGWNVIPGAPSKFGLKWVSNGRSRFSGEYKHALLIEGDI